MFDAEIPRPLSLEECCRRSEVQTDVCVATGKASGERKPRHHTVRLLAAVSPGRVGEALSVLLLHQLGSRDQFRLGGGCSAWGMRTQKGCCVCTDTCPLHCTQSSPELAGAGCVGDTSQSFASTAVAISQAFRLQSCQQCSEPLNGVCGTSN